jgi:hypothetical protein
MAATYPFGWGVPSRPHPLALVARLGAAGETGSVGSSNGGWI